MKLVDHKDKTLLVKTFSFDSIELKKLRKNSSRKTIVGNVNKYGEWVVSQLKLITGIKEGVLYDATCIYMNNRNVDKLEKCIKGINLLEYGPCECDDLEDDEYGIYPLKIFSKER